MNASNSQVKNVVFFDGVCNLCNELVDFLLRKDKKTTLIYSSLQSAFASEFFKERKVDITNLDTVYFYDGSGLYKKSQAISKIIKMLPYPFKALGIVIYYTPNFIGDKIYDLIAKKRYLWFGRKDTCRVPTARELKQFIE